jgi:hypothetical protein
VVNDLKELMVLVGEELFVRGTEIVVDVVAEGGRSEVQGVQPLEEREAGRGFQGEDRGKKLAVGERAGRGGVGKEVSGVCGRGRGKVVGGLAVGTEEE